MSHVEVLGLGFGQAKFAFKLTDAMQSTVQVQHEMVTRLTCLLQAAHRFGRSGRKSLGCDPLIAVLDSSCPDYVVPCPHAPHHRKIRQRLTRGEVGRIAGQKPKVTFLPTSIVWLRKWRVRRHTATCLEDLQHGGVGRGSWCRAPADPSRVGRTNTPG